MWNIMEAAKVVSCAFLIWKCLEWSMGLLYDMSRFTFA